MKKLKDGYEPSDTETEGHESSWDDPNDNPRMKSILSRKFKDLSPPGSRRNGLFKDDSFIVLSQRNISHLSKPERRRHEGSSSSMRPNSHIHGGNNNKLSQKPNPHRRAVTAPRLRMGDEQYNSVNHLSKDSKLWDRAAPSLRMNSVQQRKEASKMKSLSVGEMNELIADGKYKDMTVDEPTVPTESMSPGDIFFSRDSVAVGMKNNGTAKRDAFQSYISPKPKFVSQRNDVTYQQFEVIAKETSASVRTNNSSAVSRESSDRISSESKRSDVSGRTSESTKRFIASRRKKKNDIWLACMRKGTCRTSKSPEKGTFDEALFIEKAHVVETLKPFWADRHVPGSLSGFTFHKHEAQLLKQVASQHSYPHLLFNGLHGSGKRTLMMAFLNEIYGDSCRNVSHDLRYFQIQERKPMQVVVPVTSSAHHVELNLSSEANAKYALLGLAKEISSEYSINVEARNANPKANFKVIVLLDVDKAAADIQHLLKWIMDGYKDACKVILCCEDDTGILESVRSRCKVIKVNPPATHEIMEVLIQIAEKEEFDLSMSFASKIATKAKQNLRKAIMALEACKAHNYPFTDDQSIAIGWEETLVELAAQILSDPSNTRLYSVKEKIQKLLVDSVHSKLILQKLVEHFLKRVEQSSKRELYYWHAYYNKRLPTGTGTGTSALSKLEEFVAKFTSMYRKSSVNFL